MNENRNSDFHEFIILGFYHFSESQEVNIQKNPVDSIESRFKNYHDEPIPKILAYHFNISVYHGLWR